MFRKRPNPKFASPLHQGVNPSGKPVRKLWRALLKGRSNDCQTAVPQIALKQGRRHFILSRSGQFFPIGNLPGQRYRNVSGKARAVVIPITVVTVHVVRHTVVWALYICWWLGRFLPWLVVQITWTSVLVVIRTFKIMVLVFDWAERIGKPKHVCTPACPQWGKPPQTKTTRSLPSRLFDPPRFNAPEGGTSLCDRLDRATTDRLPAPPPRNREPGPRRRFDE